LCVSPKGFVTLGEQITPDRREPLVRAEIPRLVERLAKIEGIEDLTLTTNGYLLPKYASALKDAGLGRITVSLDSLDDEVFGRMNGRDYTKEHVLRGIEAADKVGLRPIKINCVVQRGVNDHTIVDLARYFKGTGHIVRYIEFMDVGNLNGLNISQVVTAREILDRINAELPVQPAESSFRGEVEKRYVYKDGSGEIGIIASVSNPFCGDCTRARLSTDGKLVTCLFAKSGEDLRGPMRCGASDEDLRRRIMRVWNLRTDRYSEERSANTDLSGHVHSDRKIEMYQIGG
jgi:cyclic pyranopterin phosphate synthase